MNPLVTSLFCTASLLLLVACEDRPKTTSEKIESKVDDALDQRPLESVRDAAEDTKAAAKNAAD
jgi:hypothetical protein